MSLLRTVILILISALVAPLLAHGGISYSADRVHAIKAAGGYQLSYNGDNIGSAAAGYHYGLYSIVGWQFDAMGGYLFNNEQPYFETSFGLGWLFFYFDLGILQTIGENGAMAWQYGLSAPLYSNYDTFFLQITLRSIHYMGETSNPSGFRVQAYYGYRLNSKRRR